MKDRQRRWVDRMREPRVLAPSWFQIIGIGLWFAAGWDGWPAAASGFLLIAALLLIFFGK